MQPGHYPVYADAWQSCHSDSLGCKQSLDSGRVPVDTLIVSRTLSALASELRMGAKASASFAGGRVHVNLPGSARGAWKAELFAITGRSLAAAEFSGEGGSTIVPDFGSTPERGVYRLRLRAPDGKIHTLPLVRRD
jgi:hypothetical protein